MRTCQRAAHGAALFYVLSAASALACPTAADMSGAGVRFTGPNGDRVTHSRIDPARTQADWTAGEDGFASRSILIHGTYVEAYGDLLNGQIDPNTRGAVTRPTPAEAMPVPEPGLTWSTAQVFTDTGGAFNEQLEISVADAEKLILSGCEYEVFPVTMVITSGGTPYTEEVTYFPSLGTGILVAVTDVDGRYTFDYNQISVEAAQ